MVMTGGTGRTYLSTACQIQVGIFCFLFYIDGKDTFTNKVYECILDFFLTCLHQGKPPFQYYRLYCGNIILGSLFFMR